MENVSSKSNKSLKLNGPAFDLSNVAAFQIPIYLGEFGKYEGVSTLSYSKSICYRNQIKDINNPITIDICPLVLLCYRFAKVFGNNY